MSLLAELTEQSITQEKQISKSETLKMRVTVKGMADTDYTSFSADSRLRVCNSARALTCTSQTCTSSLPILLNCCAQDTKQYNKYNVRLDDAALLHQLTSKILQLSIVSFNLPSAF